MCYELIYAYTLKIWALNIQCICTEKVSLFTFEGKGAGPFQHALQ